MINIQRSGAIRLIAFALIFFYSLLSFCQVIPEEKQQYYVDSIGNVFANQQMELFLFIAPEDNPKDKVLLESSTPGNNSITFDRHGLHTIVHRDPGNLQSTFEVFADGIAPKTELSFPKGLIMRYDNRYYCQDSAQIALKASDSHSGVSHTYYSINKSDYVIWDNKTIHLPLETQLEILYYSVDNVGNIEKVNSAFVYFDTESIIELEEIFFDHNSVELNPESRKQLDELVKSLKDFPELRILLMSHTDSRGTASYNLRLSQQRAESVKAYLVSRGIHPSRLETKGYGDTKIRNECVTGVDCTEEKHKYNRRTEFQILPF